MKKAICISACGAAALLCSSCITSTLAAVSGAKALDDQLGISSLFSSSAPENLNGHTLALSGEKRTGEAEAAFSASLAFGGQNPCAIKYNGAEYTAAYTRQADKKARVVLDGPGRETYRLIFTSGTEGTYAYEGKAADGTVSTGEGRFSIK